MAFIDQRLYINKCNADRTHPCIRNHPNTKHRWFGIVSPDGTPKYALSDGFCPSEKWLKEEAAAKEREAAAAPEPAAVDEEASVLQQPAQAEGMEEDGAK